MQNFLTEYNSTLAQMVAYKRNCLGTSPVTSFFFSKDANKSYPMCDSMYLCKNVGQKIKLFDIYIFS